ncbi:MAG TPA: tRNA epoxyqueuosine(34) reductase QueG [bacterium]|nr:tRNA epoxyqueuosine(34) reductase QueG [bacterium]
MRNAEKIKEKAHELGFELVGISPAHPAPDFDFFRWWLDKGFGATMTYLNRQAERRGDPEKVLPGVKSVICVALNYHTGAAGGRIASYAHGEDYHRVIGEKLRTLEAFIVATVDPSAKTKSYIDTGPVLERSYAARAGLGWIGKNTMLLNDGLGSYVFLGEILTTLAFGEEDYGRPALDQCGTCTKCLDACPTQAFPEPGVLDANRCISYLTIEYKKDFTPEQAQMAAGHLYGCDVCQAVCPYNDRIPSSPLKEFWTREVIRVFLRDETKRLDEADFFRLIAGSAMDRISFKQWKRNCGEK